MIAHDFAETYGGAERICAELGHVFPDAELWTILGRSSVVERMGFARHRSLLPGRERLLRHYRLLAPLYPFLVGSRALPEADLLVTSSYAFAHGFRTRNAAPQLCYCYSPLRFAWSMTEEYGAGLRGGATARAALAALASWMRALDRRAARRVTRYVAESQYVADQLRRFYGVEAEVIWPPVDCEAFRPGAPGHDGYFLYCSRLIEPYKRPSLVVEAFRDLPYRLLIAGDGPERERLRRIAPSNVEFLGPLSTAELIPVMQRCAATVFPSRDDFGLVPVESMACGRPVLAYAAGGALETVVPGITGEFFTAQTAGALRSALRGFDPDRYDPQAVRSHAERFGVQRFRSEIAAAAAEVASATGP